MPLALIVHGGAGAIASQRQQPAREGCAAAAVIGWRILQEGGTALDAVTASIVALEDNPLFNAGTGAVLTREGVAELDAGIMEGTTLGVGAVAGVRRIKNPILLAREVLHGPQVLLIGAGAESYAVTQGMALCDPQVLITEDQRARQRASLSSADGRDDWQPLHDPEGRHGTVGAVALDAAGHIVAAASTGGVANKPSGRVGDTPIVGAGFYAEDAFGGVSCTGRGEDFMRLLVARRAIEAIAAGSDAQSAANASVTLLGARIHGEGGLIIVDHAGNVGFARNTSSMSYAYITTGMSAPQSGV